MRKLTLKIVNVVFLFSLVLLWSCSGREQAKEENKQGVTTRESTETAVTSDTIWKKQIHYKFFTDLNYERIFTDTINEEIYTIRIKSQTSNEKYFGVTTYEEDGQLYAQKHVGINATLSFQLYDSKDNMVAQSSWDRYDLEPYISKDLLAGSAGAFWNSIGYLDEFDQFCLTTYWMFEESDVGEKYVIFLDKNMAFQNFFFDSFTGGGACDCNDEPSIDGKTFAFCSRIYRSNGKHTMLSKKDQEVTGSYIINDDYCLVIYNYEGKPPYDNARIIDKRGVAVKKFDYTGITQALGYVIPLFKVKDQEAIFLLDQEKRCFFRVDLNNPLEVEVILIDDLDKMVEGEVLNHGDSSYLEVSSETKTFYFEYKNQSFRYYGESEDW